MEEMGKGSDSETGFVPDPGWIKAFVCCGFLEGKPRISAAELCSYAIWCWLLIAQRHHRIYVRRSARRQKSCETSDRRQYADCHQRRRGIIR